MLHACEEIYLASPGTHWEKTIKDQLGTHQVYLTGEYFREAGHLAQLSANPLYSP